MELKILNNTQKQELSELLSYFKYFYVCNKCGVVYGSDHLDSNLKCPKCVLKREKQDGDS